MTVSIPEQALSDTAVNATSSSKLASEHFLLEPKNTWACKPIYDTIYCENFWETSDKIKQGIGIKSNPVTFTFCLYKPGSQNYSRQSCITEFAKTGVK